MKASELNAKSVEELKALGLNTRSNYDLAETFVYTDYKVCNIRNSEGKPIGKRVEVRGFDAGELGALAAVPFCHALLRDPAGRGAVQGLLADRPLIEVTLETQVMSALHRLSPRWSVWLHQKLAAHIRRVAAASG